MSHGPRSRSVFFEATTDWSDEIVAYRSSPSTLVPILQPPVFRPDRRVEKLDPNLVVNRHVNGFLLVRSVQTHFSRALVLWVPRTPQFCDISRTLAHALPSNFK